MSFKIEDGVIKVSKDCKTCTHLNVCKYHSKMRDLCKSNEFYGMNEYLKWNNSLTAFELNASCQYFKLDYDIPEDGSVTLEVDENIINKIVSFEKPNDLISYCVKIKDNIVTFKIKNKETIDVKITDLLSKYKFVTK